MILKKEKFKSFSELNQKLNILNNNLENITNQNNIFSKNKEINLKENLLLELKNVPKNRENIQKQLNILIENRQKFSQYQKLLNDLESYLNNKKPIEFELEKFEKLNFEITIKNIQK